jgi:hypothetical protein
MGNNDQNGATTTVGRTWLMRIYSSALGLIVAGVCFGACGPRVSIGDLGNGAAGGSGGSASSQAGSAVTQGEGGNDLPGVEQPQGGAGPVCTSGQIACLGNQVGTCASDGLSLAAVTEDCAANGQVCDESQACSASVVDAIGVGLGVQKHPLKLGMILADLIDVDMPRVITKLEAHLDLVSEAELVWLIYEWDGAEYRLRAEDSTMESAGDAFFGSGSLSYELQPGKRYAVGVYTVAPDSSYYTDDAPTQRTLSFGAVRGGNISGGYDYRDGSEFQPFNYQPQLRVTTQLP